MNKYAPLQDTVSLLAGAKIRRTLRPEERFEPDEPIELIAPPSYATRIQEWLLSSLNRFRPRLRSVEQRSGEGELNVTRTTTP
jgi:hypothetical protein